jgi:3'-phosphoadenosine 5'-phosphosulfate (PAPS) 3'-phosphatase
MRWLKKAYVLARDGYLCQYCEGESGDSKLQIHHLVASGDGGSCDHRNLLTVCQACHDKINNGYKELYGRSTERLFLPRLDESDLQRVKQAVRKLLLGEVKVIAMSARHDMMQTANEISFVDFAITAHIQIEKTLRKALTHLIPWSLVFYESDFSDICKQKPNWLSADMVHRRYTWIIDPLDGMEAFRNPGDNNYRITVTLADDLSPLASFVYLPEYEIDGTRGALFETVGEEMPINDVLTLLKTRRGELYPAVYGDMFDGRWHSKKNAKQAEKPRREES